jgi:hypothetical protein
MKAVARKPRPCPAPAGLRFLGEEHCGVPLVLVKALCCRLASDPDRAVAAEAPREPVGPANSL